MMSTAYLNGEFLPLAETQVSVLDRGFLFGDGVYELIPVYDGRLFRLEQHVGRLESSLSAIRIDNPHSREEWGQLLAELVQRNGGGDQKVYVQVTRGAAKKRRHEFPEGAVPTVFVMTRVVDGEPEPVPAKAVTREDHRWGRCDIKAITLLANVLYRQEAFEAGCQETILTRDGFVTEGAVSNVFVVRDDYIVTPPKGRNILPGITRDLVVELATDSSLPCVEAAISEGELREANEIWITASTIEVIPVVELDGRVVGNGRPGPVWNKMRSLFQAYRKANGET